MMKWTLFLMYFIFIDQNKNFQQYHSVILIFYQFHCMILIFNQLHFMTFMKISILISENKIHQT